MFTSLSGLSHVHRGLAGQEVVTARREHVHHLRVLGKPRLVLDTARNHSEHAGAARALVVPDPDVHPPRQHPEGLLMRVLVRGGVRSCLHRPPDLNLFLPCENAAADLVRDLLLREILQRAEALHDRHGRLLGLSIRDPQWPNSPNARHARASPWRASTARRWPRLCTAETRFENATRAATVISHAVAVKEPGRAARGTMPRAAQGDAMARLKIGFIPIEGGHYYREALDEVTRAEELGFDSVWMEEHHAVTNHYWPSPLTVLAGFATRTSKMMLGTDIVVAAFHHPVRLAEDVAMLDVMSGGRVTLGIAIGYKPDEFALYGVDLEKRGARFEEQLAIMRGLWTQDRVSFRGKFYTVDGRLEPKPLTKPHPPVWIGGWGDLTLRRAATLGDNWIPGPTADLARLLAGKRRFLENRAEAGRLQPVVEWPLTRDLIIADTDQRARELAEEHIMVAYRKEYAGGWRHPFIDASIATDLDRLMENRFLIGGPDQVIAKIRTLVDEYGMTHLICRTFFPGMPHTHIMRELELLAREVMPAFR